jgi:NAD+ kinase
MTIVKPLSKKIQKIGIIAKSTITEQADILHRIVKVLHAHKKTILPDKHSAPLIAGTVGLENHEIFSKSDLVLILGGDGTILRSAGAAGKKITPVLGINLGNLGFNAETTPEKAEETILQIFDGKYFLDKRFLLRVTLYRNKEKMETFLALNDAVINQGLSARLIELKVEIDGRRVVSFKADGMIVASPTGSTAHSLSAGGPIVHPTLNALVLTPICPVTLAIRPIIIPNNRQISVTVETQRRGSYNIGLTIDGQQTVPLEYGDKVKIRKSSRNLYLVRIDTKKYYRQLREKLGWGTHCRD